MKPEYKCPECGSIKLTLMFESENTYTVNDDGSLELECTDEQRLLSLECGDCGKEGEDDADWKNKEADDA